MSKVISLFLDRLAERFVALLAGLISSRIDGLHAASQAQQQSELEDLARQYEAAGKIEIATHLRKRALGLTSSNLASEALEIVRQVAGEPLHLPGPQTPGMATDVRGLPPIGDAPAGKTKRQITSAAKKSADSPGDIL